MTYFSKKECCVEELLREPVEFIKFLERIFFVKMKSDMRYVILFLNMGLEKVLRGSE